MSKIKVLIVDDSPFIRKALLRIFEDEPFIQVVGVARNGREAIDKAISLTPDVITLDIMMPEMDGLEALKILMEARPVPVLMLSQFTQEGADLTLNALDLGAMDFIDKSSTSLMDFSGLAADIISKIKAIAGKKPRKISSPVKIASKLTGSGAIDVVVIGTSTGGPSALQVLLPKLPGEIRFGVLVVQHMPRGFTGPLAKRLDAMCEIRVREAEDGDGVLPGTALIAPSGFHMKIMKEGVVRLDVEPLNTVHRPSVDVLFESVAENYGSRSLGVILTGMGSDGVQGLKRIKEMGGATLAQDEATSTIFGMPKVAIESNIVDHIASITDMADEILKRA